MGKETRTNLQFSICGVSSLVCGKHSLDCLDLSIVDFTGTGGPPPAHKFAVSAWTINVVLAADSHG